MVKWMILLNSVLKITKTEFTLPTKSFWHEMRLNLSPFEYKPTWN